MTDNIVQSDLADGARFLVVVRRVEGESDQVLRITYAATGRHAPVISLWLDPPDENGVCEGQFADILPNGSIVKRDTTDPARVLVDA